MGIASCEPANVEHTKDRKDTNDKCLFCLCQLGIQSLGTLELKESHLFGTRKPTVTGFTGWRFSAKEPNNFYRIFCNKSSVFQPSIVRRQSFFVPVSSKPFFLNN